MDKLAASLGRRKKHPSLMRDVLVVFSPVGMSSHIIL